MAAPVTNGALDTDVVFVDATAQTDAAASAQSLHVAEFAALPGYPLLAFRAPRPADRPAAPAAAAPAAREPPPAGFTYRVLIAYHRPCVLDRAAAATSASSGGCDNNFLELSAAAAAGRADADSDGPHRAEGLGHLPEPPMCHSWAVTESRAAVDCVLRRAAARWGGESEVVLSFLDMIADADALIADFNDADDGVAGTLSEAELVGELESVRDAMLLIE